MFKRVLSALLVICALVCCASCDNDSVDYYFDDDGAQYMICRDSNGEIQVNENGKLLVYNINENGKRIKSDSGEYITEYVDFNGQIVSGKTVEIPEMRFTLPNNFVDDRDNPGYFRNDTHNGEIFIFYYTDSLDLSIEAIESSCETLLESFGSEVYSYERYKINIDGVECVAFEQLCISSEYYQNAFVYLIPYDSGYYRIDCNISTDYKNKVNFDKFVETIDLKNL